MTYDGKDKINPEMKAKLIEKPGTETKEQLIRYVVASIIASSADFSLLYVLTEYCGVHYLTSAVPAFLLGLVISYILNISWVFDNRKFNDWWFEFGIFATIGVIGLFLNEVFIWFFTEKVHFYYLVSKIISVCIVFFWNFFVRKMTLFAD